MTSLGVARSQLRKVIETHLQAYKDILDDQWLERKHEVDQKWAEILKVKSENNQKSTEIQKVKSENENVWSNLKYHISNANQLKDHIKKKNSESNEKDREIAIRDKEVKYLKSEIANFEKKIEALNRRESEVNNKNIELENENTTCKEELSSGRRKIISLYEKIKTTNKMDAELKEKKMKISDLEEENGYKDSEIDELKQNVKKLQENLEVQKVNNADLEEELKQSKKNNSDLEERVENEIKQNANIVDMKSEIISLKEASNFNEEFINKMTKEIIERKKLNSDLEEKLGYKDTEIGDLKLDLKKLKNDKLKEIDELKVKIDELGKDLRENQENHNNIVINLNSEISEITEKYEILKKNIQKITEKYKDQEEQISLHQEDFDRYDGELKEKNKKILDLETVLKRFERNMYLPDEGDTEEGSNESNEPDGPSTSVQNSSRNETGDESNKDSSIDLDLEIEKFDELATPAEQTKIMEEIKLRKRIREEEEEASKILISKLTNDQNYVKSCDDEKDIDTTTNLSFDENLETEQLDMESDQFQERVMDITRKNLEKVNRNFTKEEFDNYCEKFAGEFVLEKMAAAKKQKRLNLRGILVKTVINSQLIAEKITDYFNSELQNQNKRQRLS